MAPDSQLKIATGAVNRLVKEKASYHKELQQQEARIANYKADDQDENAEYMLKQERKAADETKAIFPELRKKIEQSLARLEKELSESSGSSEDDTAKAKEAIETAKAALQQDS